LQGRVVDSKTRQPLPGVNILLRGTVLGTASGADGRFRLVNIPVGRYDIQVSMMGYKTEVFPQVRIGPDSVTTLLVELKETVITAPALVVTASKTVQQVIDSPVSVAVLSSSEIRQRNTFTVDNALRYLPGVYFARSELNIRGSSGYSRGAGSRVLLLIDGNPAITGDAGTINWDLLPATEVARVEVVKGAGSALYGSNALGGVVNILTRDPTEVPQTRVRLSWGFYDKPYYPEWRWTNRLRHFNAIDLSHSRQVGKLGMLLSFGRKTSTGYQENGHFLRWSALGKFKYRFSPRSHLTFFTVWAVEDHGELLFWKGINHPYEVPEVSVGDEVLSEKLTAHLTYKLLLSRKLALTVKTSYYHTDWRNEFHDNNDYSRTHKFGHEWQWEYLPSSRHSLTYGFESIYHRAQSSIFGNPYTFDLALYAQDEIRFRDNLRTTLGFRFDYHQVERRFSEKQLSPKFGSVYQPTPTTAFRISVSRGFRAASIAEIFTHTLVSGFEVIPNLDLRAESVWSYEIGLHKIVSEYLIWDVALFQNDFENMIEPRIVGVGLPKFQLANIVRSRIRGVEFSAQGNLWRRRLFLRLSYMYLDAKRLDEGPTVPCLDDPTYKPSKALPYRPEHTVVASGNFRLWGIEVGLDWRYLSRYKEVAAYCRDPRVPQKVVDLRVQYQRGGITLAGKVENLLQYNYTEVERSMAPMRNFTFTLMATL